MSNIPTPSINCGRRPAHPSLLPSSSFSLFLLLNLLFLSLIHFFIFLSFLFHITFYCILTLIIPSCILLCITSLFSSPHSSSLPSISLLLSLSSEYFLLSFSPLRPFLLSFYNYICCFHSSLILVP